jgi:hypothetical protein
MGYPKSIYAKVKPKMTKEEALEKAKAEKPKFRTAAERVKSGKIANVIAQMEEIFLAHPDAKLVQGYYGSSVEIRYKEQIPVEERARYILEDDKDRWIFARERAEMKYDDEQHEAEQKELRANRAAFNGTPARHCSCCACSKGV